MKKQIGNFTSHKNGASSGWISLGRICALGLLVAGAALIALPIWFGVRAAAGDVDPSFNPSVLGGGTINSVAVQPDGKMVVVGLFTAFNGVETGNIERLNADGTIDSSFNTGTGFTTNGIEECVVLQPDGKIIVGGVFGQFNGVLRRSLLRLNADGSLDTTFAPSAGIQGAGRGVYSIALQPDGKMIVGGNFTTFNSTSRNSIVRVNPDGSLDTTFNPGTGTGSSTGGETFVYNLALQPDGKIIIGGFFNTYNGTARSGIARLNSD